MIARREVKRTRLSNGKRGRGGKGKERRMEAREEGRGVRPKAEEEREWEA